MLAGGVQWEGMGDKEGVKRLCLVRGLRNDSGLNNCFLNVVIQCLWHLHSFREALLSLQPQVRLLPSWVPCQVLSTLCEMRTLLCSLGFQLVHDVCMARH